MQQKQGTQNRVLGPVKDGGIAHLFCPRQNPSTGTSLFFLQERDEAK